MSDLKLRRMAVIRLARNWTGPMEVRALVGPRPKRMAVDELVRWAYLTELPKTPRASRPAGYGEVWRMIERAGDELSLVAPRDNRFGVVPDFAASSFPHPDAFLVHDAVCLLDECLPEIPDDWSPMGDFGDLGGHERELVADVLASLTSLGADGVRRLRRLPGVLVRGRAVIDWPDWRMDAPDVVTLPGWFLREAVQVETLSGVMSVEVEVDGWDEVSRYPKPGAYRKTALEPDPVGDIVLRAEYEVWRAALDVLFEDLVGRLASIDVLPCALPARPWEGGLAPRRVLEAVRARDSAAARGRRKKIARNA